MHQTSRSQVKSRFKTDPGVAASYYNYFAINSISAVTPTSFQMLSVTCNNQTLMNTSISFQL